ncbi:MAG: hypothetical protein KR126chlam4_00577 [Candidatus Anoxychlamydiales bacterium]|uniref:Uncharacterized protein n=1 Tax=marine sediment metagenome TaxID=412755 RepID=A0A0F9GWI0_9ZZZZ|nr:hypothetical protein [Candidatus Anoxychlamydiales bacterium]HEU64941.1 hypothetical protein [Chlamydiota bacterium]
MSTSPAQGRLFVATGSERKEVDTNPSPTDRGVARAVDSARAPVGSGKESADLRATSAPSSNPHVTQAARVGITGSTALNTPGTFNLRVPGDKRN